MNSHPLKREGPFEPCEHHVPRYTVMFFQKPPTPQPGTRNERCSSPSARVPALPQNHGSQHRSPSNVGKRQGYPRAVGGLWFVICGLLLGSCGTNLLFTGDAQAKSLRTSFHVGRSPETQSVWMAGNLDETRFLWPNVPSKRRFYTSIKIVNEGNHDVLNPRVSVNGFKPPLSSEELLQTISDNPKDPLDRVLRIFYAVSNYSTHEPSADETASPLHYFLNSSWGLCHDKTRVQSALWNLAGFRWRESEPYNHTSAEVEVQGKSLLLDTDLQTLYLKHDNLTIASAQDIRDDPLLVLRASHERIFDRFPRLVDEAEVNMYYSSEKTAALYPPRESPPPLASQKPDIQRYSILLRPGEAYGWHTGKSQNPDSFNQTEEHSAVARDLIWETSLNLSKGTHRWFLRGREEKKIRVQRDVIDMGDSILTIPYQLPFPIVGMQIRLTPGNADVTDSPDTDEKITLKIVTPKGSFEHRASYAEVIKGFYSLDALVKSTSMPLRAFQLQIDGRQSYKKNMKVRTLRGIHIRLNGVSTAFAFRALRAGENNLVYTDSSPSRSIRIDVDAEPEQLTLPSIPEASLSPRARAKIPESHLRFEWPGAHGDRIAGYHFQISLFPDMRYPLSPTFDRLVRTDQTKTTNNTIEFTLPWRGMLPVNKMLYWRVRPFDDSLLAGAWSEVNSFQVTGPGAPQDLKTTEQGGKIILTWKPANYGSSPTRYELHMSDLEGFMPMNKPHRILGLSDQEAGKRCWTDVCATSWPVAPSTFVSSTRETRMVFSKSTLTDKLKKRVAHWRVIAVDAEGSQSCPSPQGHLRTPMLVPPDIIVLPPGNITYRLPVINTRGRVLAGPPDYYLGTWSQPKLNYAIQPMATQPPSGWKMDPTTGVIRGTLTPREQVALQVSVQDHYGQKDTTVVTFKAGERKHPVRKKPRT